MSFVAAEHPYEIAVVSLEGPFPDLIDWATHGHYCHAFPILPTKLIEAEPQGVIESPLNRYDGCEVLVSDLKLNVVEQVKFAAFVEAQVGKRYDFLGDFLVGMDDVTPKFMDPMWHLIEHLEDREHCWFCSALADATVSATGRKLFTDGRPFHAVTPNDIARLLQAA